MKSIFTSKTDLAQAFFPYVNPRHARHKLMQIINADSTLMAALCDAGYSPLSHLLSPAQVDIIVQRLGDPFHLPQDPFHLPR